MVNVDFLRNSHSISELTSQVESELHNADKTLKSSEHLSTHVARLQDATELFHLWAGNIGAYHEASKRESMDHRLQIAPRLKEEVCTLLLELLDALGDLVHTESPCPSAEASHTHDNTPNEAMEELIDIIFDCVRGLLRLSILIRKATPRDRYEKALQKSNLRFTDHFDILHVEEKFPKLRQDSLQWLAVRLGRAITDRRRFLAYCRDHSEHLDREAEGSQSEPVEQPMATQDVPHASSPHPQKTAKTVIGTIKASTKASTLNIAAFQERRELCDIDDAVSYTTIGDDALCFDEDGTALVLPSLESLKQGKEEFECPLCRGILDIESEKRWRRHAFADLRAYVCTSGQKECDLARYADRKSWFAHELQCHRHQWRCILCDNQPYLSAAKFKIHLAAKHPIIPESQYLAVIRSCQEPLNFIPAADCPFCDTWEAAIREQQARINRSPAPSTENVLVVSWRQFRRHAASHLEQLALFAARNFIVEEQHDTDSLGAINAISAKGSLPALEPDDFASEPESTETTRYLPAVVDEPGPQSSLASQEVGHAPSVAEDYPTLPYPPQLPPHVHSTSSYFRTPSSTFVTEFHRISATSGPAPPPEPPHSYRPRVYRACIPCGKQRLTCSFVNLENPAYTDQCKRCKQEGLQCDLVDVRRNSVAVPDSSPSQVEPGSIKGVEHLEESNIPKPAAGHQNPTTISPSFQQPQGLYQAPSPEGLQGHPQLYRALASIKKEETPELPGIETIPRQSSSRSPIPSILPPYDPLSHWIPADDEGYPRPSRPSEFLPRIRLSSEVQHTSLALPSAKEILDIADKANAERKPDPVRRSSLTYSPTCTELAELANNYPRPDVEDGFTLDAPGLISFGDIFTGRGSRRPSIDLLI